MAHHTHTHTHTHTDTHTHTHTLSLQAARDKHLQCAALHPTFDSAPAGTPAASPAKAAPAAAAAGAATASPSKVRVGSCVCARADAGTGSGHGPCPVSERPCRAQAVPACWLSTTSAPRQYPRTVRLPPLLPTNTLSLSHTHTHISIYICTCTPTHLPACLPLCLHPAAVGGG